MKQIRAECLNLPNNSFQIVPKAPQSLSDRLSLTSLSFFWATDAANLDSFQFSRACFGYWHQTSVSADKIGGWRRILPSPFFILALQRPNIRTRLNGSPRYGLSVATYYIWNGRWTYLMS